METLHVSIDYGASSTKVFFGLTASAYEVLIMPPHSIELDKSLLPPPSTDTNYENRAWVGIEDRYYAVGNLAKTTYSAIAPKKPLKVESLLQKTCAVIYIAAQVLGLEKKFGLVLNYVLPPGELGNSSNRDLLTTDLKNVLKLFDTPSGKMRVRLISCGGYPEGMGLLLFHRKHFPESADRSVGLFMIGYRNASMFTSRKGVVGDYQSNDLGFNFYLKQITSRSAGYDLDDLIEPIHKYQQPTDEVYLRKILRAKDKERQEIELSDLKELITASRSYYWTMLRTWIDECLDSDIDRVIICGGTADYLRRELETHLKPKFPSIMNGKSELYFHSSINLPGSVQSKGMGFRLADVYCLWLEHFKHG
jgi:hypothetical protein